MRFFAKLLWTLVIHYNGLTIVKLNIQKNVTVAVYKVMGYSGTPVNEVSRNHSNHTETRKCAVV